MRDSPLADVVLWSAIEDFAGLWEVEWELRSNGVAEDRLRDRARSIVLSLLQSGLVEAFECVEPYGDLRKLDRESAEATIARDESWLEPEADAVSVRIGATPDGEDAYYELTRKRSR